MALAGSLVLIAGLTVVASLELPGLWRQIIAQLSAIEFWNGLRTPSQFGGIVTVPILLALFVPLLVTVAALVSFIFPLVLLARLPSRPLLFPTMMSMGAVCQTALVATGWLATRLMRELSQVAATAMSKARDEEVRQLANQLTAAVGTLTATATMLLLPVVVLVDGQCFFVHRATQPRSSATSGRGTMELPNLEGHLKEEPFVAFSAEAGSRCRPRGRGRVGMAAGRWPVSVC